MNTKPLTDVNRRQRTIDELLAMKVGHAKMIAWEAVVRWSENKWEIGTWGIDHKAHDLDTTVSKLMREIK